MNWDDFVAFIDDEYVNNIDVKTHAAFKALLLSLKFHAALYLDDKELMQAVLDEIEVKRKAWNMEHFNSLHKDYDTWFNNLRDKMNKRAEFMAVIEKNCEDKKISKLTVMPIVR